MCVLCVTITFIVCIVIGLIVEAVRKRKKNKFDKSNLKV